MARLASQKERVSVMILQDYKCSICGKNLLENKFEIDHIQPFAHNGKSELLNFQALCVECHKTKTKIQIKSKGNKMTNKYNVNFNKKPRQGQKIVFDKVMTTENKNLNIKLPTGYGKSFVNAGVFSILKNRGKVNRLLIIVPSTSQKVQFENDGYLEFNDVGIDITDIIDIGYFQLQAVKKHRQNKNSIFVVTSQALSNGNNTINIIKDMMQSGSWMVTVDEYHHYGIGKAWGESVKKLNYNFLLAMSATPFRQNNDSAFGEPSVNIKYKKGVSEKALKPLKGHSYSYKLEMIDKNGNVRAYYTDELMDFIGTDKPDAIDNFIIERQMRWSPKYISPLISIPIERLLRNRISTGFKLQAIVGAMSVSHAKMICEQIKSMEFPINVDWVGTGINGKSDEENEKIIEKFNPKKDRNGKRNPKIDVLVHVGMAGEGLDVINISEVVFLKSAKITNTNNQQIGRASRYLPGVIGNINFDSCSEYSNYTGSNIMDAIDFLPPEKNEEEIKEENNEINNEFDHIELPDEPKIQIYDLELTNINSSSEIVKQNAPAVAQAIAYATKDCIDKELLIESYINDIDNPDSNFMKFALKFLKNKLNIEAEKMNEKSKVEQIRESLKTALSSVTGLVIKIYKVKFHSDVNKKQRGNIVSAINTKKMRDIKQKVNADYDNLLKHYRWIKNFEEDLIKNKYVPNWILARI